MFKRKHEIENLQAKVKSRDKVIDSLISERNYIKNENKELRFDLEEAKELIKEVEKIATSNMYNNGLWQLKKIKELVRSGICN